MAGAKKATVGALYENMDAAVTDWSRFAFPSAWILIKTGFDVPVLALTLHVTELSVHKSEFDAQSKPPISVVREELSAGAPKFVPRIITANPPEVGPVPGDTLVTVGGS